MLSNPRTTIIGYLLVIAAVLQIAVHVMTGTFSGISEHITEIITALTGVGLIAAKDGGH